MHQTHQPRSTLESWDVEKVHAAVARSTFRSQHVQNTPCLEHFWKFTCRKSAHRCGAKHISKWKCTKNTMLGALLEVHISKKCTPLWREALFEVKSAKNWRVRKSKMVRSTFGRSEVVLHGRRKGLCTLSKLGKTCWFCSSLKTMAGVGHLKRIQRCISRGSRITSIRSSGLLRWVCVTGAAPRITRHRFFAAGADRWNGIIANSYEAVRSALNFSFLKDDSLAELLRFWCCQLRKLRKYRKIVLFLTMSSSKLRKSRGIAPFLMLSSSKTEDVSQNSFVFKLADRQTIDIADNYNCNYNYTTLLQLQTQMYYATLHWLHQLHYTTLVTSNYI